MFEPASLSMSAAEVDSLYLDLQRDKDAVRNGIWDTNDSRARAEMYFALNTLEALLESIVAEHYSERSQA